MALGVIVSVAVALAVAVNVALAVGVELGVSVGGTAVVGTAVANAIADCVGGRVARRAVAAGADWHAVANSAASAKMIRCRMCYSNGIGLKSPFIAPIRRSRIKFAAEGGNCKAARPAWTRASSGINPTSSVCVTVAP